MRHPPETQADADRMADLERAGHADPLSVEVLWHAAMARNLGWSVDDCPFAEGPARRRWRDLLDPPPKMSAVKLSAAGARTAPKGPQWWMDLD